MKIRAIFLLFVGPLFFLMACAPSQSEGSGALARGKDNSTSVDASRYAGFTRALKTCYVDGAEGRASLMDKLYQQIFGIAPTRKVSYQPSETLDPFFDALSDQGGNASGPIVAPYLQINMQHSWATYSNRYGYGERPDWRLVLVVRKSADSPERRIIATESAPGFVFDEDAAVCTGGIDEFGTCRASTNHLVNPRVWVPEPASNDPQRLVHFNGPDAPTTITANFREVYDCLEGEYSKQR